MKPRLRYGVKNCGVGEEALNDI